MKLSNEQKAEIIKKELFEILGNNDLKITVQTRQHEVNFLNLTLNLLENTHKTNVDGGTLAGYAPRGGISASK